MSVECVACKTDAGLTDSGSIEDGFTVACAGI